MKMSEEEKGKKEFELRLANLKMDALKSIRTSLKEIKGVVRVFPTSKEQGVIFADEKLVVVLTKDEETNYTFDEFRVYMRHIGVRRTCKWADALKGG